MICISRNLYKVKTKINLIVDTTIHIIVTFRNVNDTGPHVEGSSYFDHESELRQAVPSSSVMQY